MIQVFLQAFIPDRGRFVVDARIAFTRILTVLSQILDPILRVVLGREYDSCRQAHHLS